MTPALIAEAARAAGLDPHVLGAFAEVETGALGPFGPDGRPTIAYEPHVALRCAPAAARQPLLDAGLGRAKAPPATWYPRGQSARWAQFEACAAIAGRDCAVQACGWGAFQIQGEGWSSFLGLDHPAAVERLARTEAGQLELLLRFADGKAGLRPALRAHDWRTVATLYNGPGAVDRYAPRLEAAYRRLSGAASPVVLRLGARGAEVRRLQRALEAAGVHDGPVDGAFGPGTEAGVRRFQAARGLTVDGVVGALTWERLGEASAVEPAAQPVPTPAADWTATLGRIAAGAGAVAAALKGLGEATETTAEALAAIDPALVALGIGGGLALAGAAWLARRWRAGRVAA